MNRLARLAATVTALALIGVACGDSSAPDTSSFPPLVEAGTDATPSLPDANADASTDPTLGAPCVEDAQCNDAIDCTFDRCDPSVARCRHVPDDALCQDDIFCNGREKCSILAGCQAGAPEACADGNACTIDVCVEASKACARKDRDVDQDGEPDVRCFTVGDCDDEDPLVSHAASEVCGNGKDDDCDGLVDEAACIDAENDACATASTLSGAGTFVLTTRGAKKDIPLSCNVSPVNGARDIVVAIDVPAGAPKDVILRADSSAPEVALALTKACGAGEVQCAHVAPGVGRARAIGRALPAGRYFVTIQTLGESDVTLHVNFAEATTPPSNESCAAPTPIGVNKAVPVTIVDAKRDDDVETACATGTGELTYAFDLAEAADVRLYAQADVGSPVVSLRDAADCTKETRCRGQGAPALFARNLAAGVHVVSIAGTEPFNGTLVVQTSPPTARPADEECSAPPALVPDATRDVDLSARESIVASPCAAGLSTAVYALNLPVTSDVLLVGRFSTQDVGTVALLDGACALTTQTGSCAYGSTPLRVRKRALAPGTYRVVVGTRDGTAAQLRAFVRPTVAPTTVGGGDSCTDAFDVASGGYFVGNTALATANFDASCDTVGIPAFGAKDQLLKLVLTQRRRVVLDMGGSGYSTLLDVRQGVACAGTELPGACHVGFTESRSFLDMVLDPATYWLTVDGYNLEEGPWNLDVRVVQP